MYYKHGLHSLKVPFEHSDSVERNFSQAFQDIFVLTMLNGKSNGTFLEIGAFDPIEISNTFLLERDFQWNGLSLDIDPEVEKKFKHKRRADFFTGDAVTADYRALLKTTFGTQKRIDYLCLDIEPRIQTLACLRSLPLDEYRFSVITYETDFYSKESSEKEAIRIRDESRRLLTSHGYLLVGKGISCSGPEDVFEDWYVDPSIVPSDRFEELLSPDEFNDSGERFLTKGPHIVATELWNGQGLGNQIWAYLATRSIAKHRGIDFAIMGADRFKGQDFMKLDFGLNLTGGSSPEGGPPTELPFELTRYRRERKLVLTGTRHDISPFDPQILEVPINTKIEGTFQSLKYLECLPDDLVDVIRLTGPFPEIPDDWCLIHVRGGDFKNLIPIKIWQEYYRHSMEYIDTIAKSVQFKCVTDDPTYARILLGDSIEILGSSLLDLADSRRAPHHLGGPIEVDFKYLNSAKYLIIPNSSFSWWAAYLNRVRKIVIAPKYWALFGSPIKTWSTFDILTPEFMYMDEFGNVESYIECMEVHKASKNYFISKSEIEESKRVFRDNYLVKRYYSWLLKFKIGKLIQKSYVSSSKVFRGVVRFLRIN